VCIATVTACLPYLLLKLAWVLGWPLGASGEEFTDSTRVANLVTAGLELTAVLLAVLLVYPLGRRVPAVVVVLPAWVATGLLTPVVIGATLGAVVQALTGGGNPFVGDEVLAGWVFVAVYGGFVVQAVLILAGFVLHARDRWPILTGGGRASAGAGATRSLQTLLGGTFIAAAVAFAVQQLSWGLRGGGGFTDPATAQRVFLVSGALVAGAAAAATWRLMRGARLSRIRLVPLWVGTAVTFTGSLSQTLTTLTIEPGAWGDRGASPSEAALTLLVLLGAVTGAIGVALRLVEEERRGGRTCQCEPGVEHTGRVDIGPTAFGAPVSGARPAG
jgi:hypothetical protein